MDAVSYSDTGLSAPRHILFLQGVASGFFSDLGRALVQAGHCVYRINFNFGDRRFWNLPSAVDYRGGLAAWPAFLNAHIRRWGIADIVLLGDCRPLHAAAITVGRNLGIDLHIFEEGYLRPDWLTHETQGVNGFSNLPRTIGAYLTDPSQDGPVQESLPSDMLWRSLQDVRYTLISLIMFWYFPKYRHYRPYHPLVEYMAGARRLVYRYATRRPRAATLTAILAHSASFYVWPMQIEVDSQITIHSRFAGVEAAVDLVFRSFAEQAPAGAILVLTEHPLETSPRNWCRFITAQARRHGLADRVIYLVNGTPDSLLEASRGVVVINSTVGQKALLWAFRSSHWVPPSSTCQGSPSRAAWTISGPARGRPASSSSRPIA
jgi:capsular polysaccharide export protein